MIFPGLPVGFGILLLQIICVTAIPLAWWKWRSPSLKFCLEEVWAAGVLSVSAQALCGTLWSTLQLPAPPLTELALYMCSGIVIGEILHRFPPPGHALISKSWMGVVMAITLLARLIPAAMQSSLGQSDAYSHLQFGMELLGSGQLSNPVYPVGHAWVHILPALIFRIDLYTLYRYGGAFYGLGLVLGVFFVSRRAFNERAATCAALLAAGFPLMLPLIKTGVGVYANQFGLMLVPFVLWALPRRFYLSIPVFIALTLSVPMMMLDLLPVILLFLIFNAGFKRIGWILLIGGSGVGFIFWKLLQLPPAHLEATFYMLSGQEDIETLPQLMLHYLQWKPVALSTPVQLGIACLTLFSTGCLLKSGCRKPKTVLLFLLCGFCGFQSFSGCFQFANYQRAGWLFLTGLAMVSGGTGWWTARRLRLHMTARPLLALSCLGLIFHPPLNHPHLSSAENELITFLRSLPGDARGVVWSRPFNNFGGGQGDPVRVLLRHHTDLRIRQVQKNEFPRMNPQIINWIIIDTAPPSPTRQSSHDREVYTLWQRNQLLQLALEQFPPDQIELYRQGSLKVWKITPAKEVIGNVITDPL